MKVETMGISVKTRRLVMDYNMNVWNFNGIKGLSML